MNMPSFYDEVAPITVVDPLAKLLGASENGILTYTYADVVKLAGHSCPTVAGAYLMIRKGLKELYGDALPVRGDIRVGMRGRFGDGVVGVVSSVATLITGATAIGGFHGLAGRYDRRNLLAYESGIDGDMRLERTDTGSSVTLAYDHSCVPFDPAMQRLMPIVLSGAAGEEQTREFGLLWQERVKKILLEFTDDERVVRIV